MSIVKLKVKTRLYSEADLELLSKDLNIPLDENWGKRTILFRGEEIYRVTNHSPGTCIVTLYDGEMLLVYESFNQVYLKWEEAEKKDKKAEKEEETPVEESDTPQTDEEDEED